MGMMELEGALVCVGILIRDDMYLYRQFSDLISIPMSLPCIR